MAGLAVERVQHSMQEVHGQADDRTFRIVYKAVPSSLAEAHLNRADNPTIKHQTLYTILKGTNLSNGARCLQIRAFQTSSGMGT